MSCHNNDQESLYVTESVCESSRFEMFDNVNESVFPDPPDEPDMRIIKDNMMTRSDNIVVFTTENGDSLRPRSANIAQGKDAPPNQGYYAKVMCIDNRYTIALIVKETRISGIRKRD